MQTLCSHHQGLDPQPSGPWGAVASLSAKPEATFPGGDGMGCYQGRAASVYSDWEDKDNDDEFNLQGNHEAILHDQAGCLPSEMVVMQVCLNKDASTDPRQVKMWFN